MSDKEKENLATAIATAVIFGVLVLAICILGVLSMCGNKDDEEEFTEAKLDEQRERKTKRKEEERVSCRISQQEAGRRRRRTGLTLTSFWPGLTSFWPALQSVDGRKQERSGHIFGRHHNTYYSITSTLCNQKCFY